MLNSPNDMNYKKAPGDQVDQVISLYQKGAIEEALASAQQLIQQYPDTPIIHNVLGACLSHTGQPKQSLYHFKEALKLEPSNPSTYNNLGNILIDLQQYEEAQKLFEYAIKINPDFAEAYNNLGNARKEQKAYEEALSHYEKAIELNPDYFEAYNNLGVAFDKLKNYAQAEKNFNKAIEISPEFAEAYSNLGSTYTDQKKYDEAIPCFEKAIQINPNYAEALKNKGLCLKSQGRLSESLIAFNEALNCNPDLFEAKSERLYLLNNICDWSELDQVKHELPQLGISTPPVRPFGFLTLEDHPERQLIRASRYVSKTYSVDPIPLPAKPKSKPDKIRIGYFSADFHEHPVSHQIAKVLASHDRSKIEVYAYSFKQADDNMRKRIIGAVDHFKDVTNMSDRDVALLARDDNIDIAIDLMGYTKNARTNIFALRAAPIQIVYLYESTMGANFIDYIIADPTTIPNRLKHHYREKIIYLPHTYMPTDNTREISNRPMTRQEMELPEDGFVFCCFNNNYKITPREFDIWMRLLLKVENSVLWLSKSNQWTKSNLQKEARLRGIDPSRLVFTKWVTRQDHLARHRLADLFLDTFYYNAHSTASDALWAGLPVVTRIGEQFVARVAASLLTAIGLPELIVKTDQEYEALALELATNQSILESIAKKLEKNRRSEPLFKTETYTQNLDQAFEQAYTHYYKGYPPKDIIV